MRAFDRRPVVLTHEEIAYRAFAIWENRGRVHGQHLQNWLQAEQELRTEREHAQVVREGISGIKP